MSLKLNKMKESTKEGELRLREDIKKLQHENKQFREDIKT